MITDKDTYMKIGQELNNHFKTAIPIDKDEEISYIALSAIYDIYPNMNMIIEDNDMDWSLKDVEKNSLYYKVSDNIHVMFNEVNYDFVTCCPDIEWEPGEKEIYRKLQVEQGLINENELNTIQRIEENYEKMLDVAEQEM